MLLLLLLLLITVDIVVEDDDTYYWVYWSSDHPFKFITKCDKGYYKMRQVSQSSTILLQSATEQGLQISKARD